MVHSSRRSSWTGLTESHHQRQPCLLGNGNCLPLETCVMLHGLVVQRKGTFCNNEMLTNEVQHQQTTALNHIYFSMILSLNISVVQF